METSRRLRWRWGINRWIVLGLMIVTVIAVNVIAAPVQPTITVAAEKIIEQPIVTLPIIGPIYLTDSLTSMVMVDLVVLGIALAVRQATRKGGLVPTGFSGAVEAAVEMMYNLTESTAGKYAKKIFPWFASILIFVLVANLIKLLPGFESIGLLYPASEGGNAIQAIGGGWFNLLPTQVTGAQAFVLHPFFRGLSTDLNFTLALALISVAMTQVVGLQTQGFRYFSKFLNFTTMFKKPVFGFMDFIVGILETISELAKILSFAFRLFGNMFAGFVLIALVGAMLPVFMPAMIFMFEFFIGAIQAFVFGMLTLVFMTQAAHGHGDESQSGAEEH
jgi:F-type H+-transporting ATPase subunit a